MWSCVWIFKNILKEQVIKKYLKLKDRMLFIKTTSKKKKKEKKTLHFSFIVLTPFMNHFLKSCLIYFYVFNIKYQRLWFHKK